MRPSGDNHELRLGDQRVTVVEVGGGLRTYVADGRDVLDGYAEDQLCPSSRGQVLAPWPNRLADGTYELDGEEQHLPVDDPGTHSSIHGLVRWLPWRFAERDDAYAALELTLHPRPGYPFELQFRVEYTLRDEGLEVRTQATNSGDAPCPFGLGHHPYLRPAVPKVDEAVVSVPARTRRPMGERSLPLPAEPVAGEFDLREPRELGATVLDATYTELIRDADGLARARVDDTTLWVDEAFGYLQVFSGDPLPDVARRSLAIEPMTCAPNAFRSGDGLRHLQSGETFTGRWGIDPGRR